MSGSSIFQKEVRTRTLSSSRTRVLLSQNYGALGGSRLYFIQPFTSFFDSGTNLSEAYVSKVNVVGSSIGITFLFGVFVLQLKQDKGDLCLSNFPEDI